MKIITTATLKGGSAKTMNTFNIGGILAETKRVLLIDIDPQSNLTSNCGINVANTSIPTIKAVFDNPPKDQPKPSEIIFKSPIEELPNLDIIPSSIRLFFAEYQMASKTNREHILDYYFRTYREFFEENYDYILIDTNPSMSIININAFYIADEIILCSDVSINGINGAEVFCALWDEIRDELHKDDNISALIIGNYEKTTIMARDLYEYAGNAQFSADLLIKTTIPHTVQMKDTEIEHATINIIHPRSEALKAYKAVLEELAEREVI